MNEAKIDHRQTKRVFFPSEENIAGAIVEPDQSTPAIPITYQSISEGGVSFLVYREWCHQFKTGNIFTLKSLHPDSLLAFLEGVHVEVKYELDYDIVPEITYGCEFKNLLEEKRKKIKEVIDFRYKKIEEGNDIDPL